MTFIPWLVRSAFTSAFAFAICHPAGSFLTLVILAYLHYLDSAWCHVTCWHSISTYLHTPCLHCLSNSLVASGPDIVLFWKCWHHVSINKLFPPTDCWRNILGLAEVVWWVAFPMLFPFSLGSGLSALVVCSASENDTFLTVSALCLPKLKWKYKPNLKLFGWCQFRINSKVN